MDDRHWICDYCQKPIADGQWDSTQRKMVQQPGDDEVVTPPLYVPDRFSDGYCHAKCLPKLISQETQKQLGADI